MSTPKDKTSPTTTVSPSLVAELLDRKQLVGRRVRLSDGQSGEVVHVEYEAPARVALVKTFPETPSPLTRAAVDRYSPDHLPAIVEVLSDRSPPRNA